MDGIGLPLTSREPTGTPARNQAEPAQPAHRTNRRGDAKRRRSQGCDTKGEPHGQIESANEGEGRLRGKLQCNHRVNVYGLCAYG